MKLAVLLAAWANLAAMPVLIGRMEEATRHAKWQTQREEKKNYHSITFVACMLTKNKSLLNNMRAPAEVPHVS